MRQISEQSADVKEQQEIPRRLALQRSTLVAHAALLSRSGANIALTGTSGVGKSTLSAGLRRGGWVLLGDDTISVSMEMRDPVAQALFPRLRLKPDSASAVCGNDEKGVGVDSFGKHVFHLREVHDPKPLDAIFVLAEQEKTVSVESLRPSDAVAAIIANCFANDPDDIKEASRRFGLAADLASHVPVFRLSYPRDYGIIPRVAAAIDETLEDLANGKGV